MKRVLNTMALLVFGLMFSFGMWAQEADSVTVESVCADSVAVVDYNHEQGLVPMFMGLGGISLGLSTFATTGGFALNLLALQASTVSVEPQEGINGALLVYGLLFVSFLGMTAIGAAIGGSLIALSTPLYAAGAAVNNCEGNWKEARYSGPLQSRFTIAVDGATNFTYGQVYLTPGYHINQRIFAGAGIAPALYWGSEQQLEKRWLLPVYGHARYTFTDKVIAPYIGVSPGYDFVQKNFYGSAEAGLRFRVNANSPESFWVALNGVTDGNFKQLGYKLGWSF